MERPNIKEYGLSVYIPFTKQRKRYNKEYENYELSLLETKQQQIFKIRKNQLANINGLSALIIAIVTTIWTFYYNIPFLQEHMSFMTMGLSQSNPSWADRTFMFLIPSTGGTIVHNIPKVLPGKKLKVVSHITIKIIPVLILTILYYLIKTEKQIYKIKKAD